MTDISRDLQQQVKQAFNNQQPLFIQGSGSKQFLLQSENDQLLNVCTHTGVINYEPTELVITARAGTSLNEIETLLKQHKQILGFEPPRFSSTATLGGTIACNMSGPRRPYAGAARDFILGCEIINGRGELLHFGGEVMKNVAGYDSSRLMAGAYGTLGVLLELSIRVLPQPEMEQSIMLEMNREEAIKICTQFRQQANTVSAACHINQQLYLRLSGNAQAVKQACEQTGGETLDDAGNFWQTIKEHQHPFFQSQKPLWRLSIPPANAAPELDDDSLLDWGGGLYWLLTNLPAAQIKMAAANAGGHATLFRNPAEEKDRFTSLPAPMRALHKKLKQAFDPGSILNPDLFSKVL